MEKTSVLSRPPHELLGPLGNAVDIDHFEAEGEVEARSGLVERLTQEVRDKALDLGYTQVVIPNGLTDDITNRVRQLVNSEPCGLRGCVLHIIYEEGDFIKTLAEVTVDPTAPNTFELYLILGPDTRSWVHKMGKFLRQLRRSRSLLLSKDFKLEKLKLY